MTIRDERGRARLANLTRLQRIGYGAIFVAAGLATGVARFSDSQRLLRQLFGSIGTLEWFLAVLRALLLLYTVLLVLGWYHWTSYELDMLTEHIEYVPPVRPRDYLLIPLVGAVLGLLIYFSNRIIIFTAIFVACDVAAAAATRDLNEGVGLALRKTRGAAGNRGKSEAIYGAIETYYLKKPHVRRIVLSCAFRLMALAFALYGALSRPGRDVYAKLVTDLPSWPICVAYALVLVVSVAAEMQILRWRGARDSAIREAVLQRE
jgi:hypothetical protein